LNINDTTAQDQKDVKIKLYNAGPPVMQPTVTQYKHYERCSIHYETVLKPA
jgi:hypothetical protein